MRKKTELIRVRIETKAMLEELQKRMKHRNIGETVEYLLGSTDTRQDQWIGKNDKFVPYKFIKFEKRWVPDCNLVKLEDFPMSNLPDMSKFEGFMDFVYSAVSVDEMLKLKEDGSWNFNRLFALHVKNCIRAVEKQMKNYRSYKPFVYAVRTTLNDRNALVFYNFMPKDAKIVKETSSGELPSPESV